MPLARYFSFVGGVLLTLLFVLDAFLPKVPVAEKTNIDLPVIRIHSDRKWPGRVVYDTSLPRIIPPQIATDKHSISLPPAVATDVSVGGDGARERQALAQMQPSDAKQLRPSNPKKREPKLQHLAKITKRHMLPQRFLAARQPQFGWFGDSFW